MNREERAKQFMPFDALKGLSDALRMKEYEVERVNKGDLTEEKIVEISKTLREIKKTDIVEIKYFCDGHYLTCVGKASLDVSKNIIKCNKIEVDFNDVMDIEIIG